MKQEGANETNNKLPDEMVQAVNKIEWKLTNKENIKKATKEMVKLCSSKASPIDFPTSTDAEIKTRMEVGKMIVQNKNESASAILDLIVEKYGLKEKNDENAKKITKQVENMCTVKANAGVYEAIKELSSLYFKEKNTNAGITYRKVSEAVKNLEFKITEKNAKGLGKVRVYFSIRILDSMSECEYTHIYHILILSLLFHIFFLFRREKQRWMVLERQVGTKFMNS